MKQPARIIVLAIAALGIRATAQPIDVAAFLKERGAEDAGLRMLARSPNPAVTLVSLYEKDNTTPSCGVLIAAPHAAKPRYVAIVGSEPDAGFPMCVGMPSITPFRLQGRNYLMIEYLSRETSDETWREFLYLVDEPGAGFVTDDTIGRGMPPSNGESSRSVLGASRPLEGIRLARAAAMKRSFPQWRFVDRDFIADGASSFATFEDGKAHACHAAVEAGDKPVPVDLADVTGAGRCAGVLAASRLTTPSATYYLALIKSDTGRQLVGIASVAADGRIKVEKTLSEDLNRAGATRDVKTAKAALAARLQSHASLLPGAERAQPDNDMALAWISPR